MNLKNYTTEVPASRSIEYIEKLLVGFGSTNIMKEYGPTGRVAAISFIVEMDGMKLPFRLPAKVQECYMWLKKQKPNSKTKDQTFLEQAERVVWKQIYEWVHINLSMIELNQAEKLEMFFPYLNDIQKGQTYYEQLKQNKFKNLLIGN
jgi:hypothetical protein